MNYMEELTTKLIKDKQLREAWKSNIAMAYNDTHAQYKKESGRNVMNKEDLHIIANKAAESFLDLLCK
jgi:hypothetical protein